MVQKLFKNALMVQIVAGIVGVIGMVVDGAVTGRCLGTDAMAAYGLVTPVATIFAACASVCELGTSVLVGRLVGARKIDEATSALSACMAFALAFSLLMTAVVFFFSGRIASLFGATGSVAEMASDYLRGFSLCAPALLLLMVLMPVMQVNGKRSVVLAAVVTMTFVNIAGDLLVGFVFKSGLLGMALATTISYWVALVLMILPLFSREKTLGISFKNLLPRYVGEMLSGGLPNALQLVCRSVLVIILNSLLLSISGNNAVAAFAVIMTAANLCMALGSGIGSSVSMLTGVFIGDKDDVAIKTLLKTAVSKAVIYDTILCAVLFAAAGLIMPIFTSDSNLLSIAVTGFRLYSLSMIGYSVNVTLRLYYQAVQRYTLSYVYVLCNSLLFTGIGAFLLSSIIGIKGVWLAYLFGETLSLIALTVFVILRGDKKRTIPDRFMMIPGNLAEDVITRFDGEASTASGIVELSENLRLFCTENNVSSRKAYILSLAVEEFGEYILQNDNGERKETVDVRLLCRKDGLTLRIRNNGKRFNPLDILKTEDTDNFSYIGIRLISKLADEIEYLDTLNLNNLVLEIKN